MDYEEIYDNYFSLSGVTGKFLLQGYTNKSIVGKDGFEYGIEYMGAYYNKEIDCQLILIENRILDEPVVDILTVINNIDDEMYQYLIKELKNRKGLRIWASQQFCEDTDLIIVRDYFGEGTAISKELMEYLLDKAKASIYKYVMIECGCIEPITEVMKC